MEINVQHYLNRVADDQVQHFDQLTSPAAVADAAGLQTALQPIFAATTQAIQAGELIRATLTIQGTQPTLVSLETGLINLPLANAKKVPGFLEPDEIVPVKVYLITESPFLNASKLRIDLLAPSDQFVADEAALLAQVTTTVQEQLAHIAEEAAKPAPVEEEAPAKKAPAKKKTATKKTTAKKPAAKKAPAKKATTKKTAAKKTTTKKASAKKGDAS